MEYALVIKSIIVTLNNATRVAIFIPLKGFTQTLMNKDDADSFFLF